MSLLLLFGIVTIAGLCVGDVSHILSPNANAREPFWWMDKSSPLGLAAQNYQGAASSISAQSHSLAENPFLNGRIHVSDVPNALHGSENLGLSTNPFLNGGKSSVHKPLHPSITNLGETGADINQLGGSSTVKPPRQALFSAPGYLPPIDTTRPQPNCQPGQQLIGGVCQCVGNTIYQNGQCVARPTPRPPPPQLICAPGQQQIGGVCQCVGNTVFQHGQCVAKPPLPQPPVRCNFNEQQINGRCVPLPTPPPQPQCSYGQQLINGICQIVCTGNTVLQGGQCVPRGTPPPPIVSTPSYLPPAVSCGPNQYQQNGQCINRPTPAPLPRCSYNEQLINGQCVTTPTQPPRPQCLPGQQLIGGVCQCTGNTIFQNGQCVRPQPICAPGQQLQNGQCVRPQPICAPGQQLQNGQCVRPQPICAPGQQLQNGQCVRPQPTPPPYRPDESRNPCSYNQFLSNGICIQCANHEIFQNGRCVPKATPPPPTKPSDYLPPVSCSYNQILQNGVCISKPTPPPICSGNTYLQNGRCVEKVTPVPPIVCTFNQILQNGRCVTKPTTPSIVPGYSYPTPDPPFALPTKPSTQSPFIPSASGTVNNQYHTPKPIVCTGNTYLQNGRCIEKVTPAPPIVCTFNQILQNGRCVEKVTPPPQPPTITCSFNQILQNGRCVPKPTTPSIVPGYSYPTPDPPFALPTKPSTQSPFTPSASGTVNNQYHTKPSPKPILCTGNTYLQNGVCVPRPTPPVQCGPNQYFQNGVCVPKPTPPTRPHTSPGYHYPEPTPSFTLPPAQIGGDGDFSQVDNIYVSTAKPIYRQDNVPSGNSNNPTFIVPHTNQDQPILPGCAAALKCVQEIYCTPAGTISPVPVIFTKEQELNRVPLTDCADQEAGIVGKCCRDTDYKDPWPSANLVNGIDNGQYREDPNLGQYSKLR